MYKREQFSEHIFNSTKKNLFPKRCVIVPSPNIPHKIVNDRFFLLDFVFNELLVNITLPFPWVEIKT